MDGKIIKIYPPRNYSNGLIYQRIEFELEDGNYGFTNIVEGFKNYNKWKKILELGKGTFISKLRVINFMIDADSDIEIIQKP